MTREVTELKEMEMKEIFEVKCVDDKKVVNRLGFFAKVQNEAVPYAWYEHENPIVNIDASLDELYEDGEPDNITLMDEETLKVKLSSFGTLIKLNMFDVSQYTPCGLYQEKIL